MSRLLSWFYGGDGMAAAAAAPDQTTCSSSEEEHAPRYGTEQSSVVGGPPAEESPPEIWSWRAEDDEDEDDVDSSEYIAYSLTIPNSILPLDDVETKQKLEAVIRETSALQADIRRRQRKLEDQEQELMKRKQDLDRQESRYEEGSVAARNAQDEMASLRAALQRREDEVNTLKKQVESSAKKLTEEREELGRIRSVLKGTQEEKDRLNDKLTAATADIQAAESAVAERAREIAGFKEKLDRVHERNRAEVAQLAETHAAEVARLSKQHAAEVEKLAQSHREEVSELSQKHDAVMDQLCEADTALRSCQQVVLERERELEQVRSQHATAVEELRERAKQDVAEYRCRIATLEVEQKKVLDQRTQAEQQYGRLKTEMELVKRRLTYALGRHPSGTGDEDDGISQTSTAPSEDFVDADLRELLRSVEQQRTEYETLRSWGSGLKRSIDHLKWDPADAATRLTAALDTWGEAFLNGELLSQLSTLEEDVTVLTQQVADRDKRIEAYQADMASIFGSTERKALGAMKDVWIENERKLKTLQDVLEETVHVTSAEEVRARWNAVDTERSRAEAQLQAVTEAAQQEQMELHTQLRASGLAMNMERACVDDELTLLLQALAKTRAECFTLQETADRLQSALASMKAAWENDRASNAAANFEASMSTERERTERQLAALLVARTTAEVECDALREHIDRLTVTHRDTWTSLTAEVDSLRADAALDGVRRVFGDDLDRLAEFKESAGAMRAQRDVMAQELNGLYEAVGIRDMTRVAEMRSCMARVEEVVKGWGASSWAVGLAEADRLHETNATLLKKLADLETLRDAVFDTVGTIDATKLKAVWTQTTAELQDYKHAVTSVVTAVTPHAAAEPVRAQLQQVMDSLQAEIAALRFKAHETKVAADTTIKSLRERLRSGCQSEEDGKQKQQRLTQLEEEKAKLEATLMVLTESKKQLEDETKVLLVNARDEAAAVAEQVAKLTQELSAERQRRCELEQTLQRTCVPVPSLVSTAQQQPSAQTDTVHRDRTGSSCPPGRDPPGAAVVVRARGLGPLEMMASPVQHGDQVTDRLNTSLLSLDVSRGSVNGGNPTERQLAKAELKLEAAHEKLKIGVGTGPKCEGGFVEEDVSSPKGRDPARGVSTMTEGDPEVVQRGSSSMELQHLREAFALCRSECETVRRAMEEAQRKLTALENEREILRASSEEKRKALADVSSDCDRRIDTQTRELNAATTEIATLRQAIETAENALDFERQQRAEATKAEQLERRRKEAVHGELAKAQRMIQSLTAEMEGIKRHQPQQPTQHCVQYHEEGKPHGAQQHGLRSGHVDGFDSLASAFGVGQDPTASTGADTQRSPPLFYTEAPLLFGSSATPGDPQRSTTAIGCDGAETDRYPPREQTDLLPVLDAKLRVAKEQVAAQQTDIQQLQSTLRSVDSSPLHNGDDATMSPRLFLSEAPGLPEDQQQSQLQVCNDAIAIRARGVAPFTSSLPSNTPGTPPLTPTIRLPEGREGPSPLIEDCHNTVSCEGRSNLSSHSSAPVIGHTGSEETRRRIASIRSNCAERVSAVKGRLAEADAKIARIAETTEDRRQHLGTLTKTLTTLQQEVKDLTRPSPLLLHDDDDPVEAQQHSSRDAAACEWNHTGDADDNDGSLLENPLYCRSPSIPPPPDTSEDAHDPTASVGDVAQQQKQQKQETEFLIQEAMRHMAGIPVDKWKQAQRRVHKLDRSTLFDIVRSATSTGDQHQQQLASSLCEPMYSVLLAHDYLKEQGIQTTSYVRCFRLAAVPPIHVPMDPAVLAKDKMICDLQELVAYHKEQAATAAAEVADRHEAACTMIAEEHASSTRRTPIPGKKLETDDAAAAEAEVLRENLRCALEELDRFHRQHDACCAARAGGDTGRGQCGSCATIQHALQDTQAAKEAAEHKLREEIRVLRQRWEQSQRVAQNLEEEYALLAAEKVDLETRWRLKRLELGAEMTLRRQSSSSQQQQRRYSDEYASHLPPSSSPSPPSSILRGRGPPVPPASVKMEREAPASDEENRTPDSPSLLSRCAQAVCGPSVPTTTGPARRAASMVTSQRGARVFSAGVVGRSLPTLTCRNMRPAKALIICATYRRSNVLRSFSTTGDGVAAFLLGKPFTLSGCEHDLRAWCTDYLPYLGWTPDNVRILCEARGWANDGSDTNQNRPGGTTTTVVPPELPSMGHMTRLHAVPTKKNILEGLDWLTTGIQPGERVLLIVEGAGGLVPVRITRPHRRQGAACDSSYWNSSSGMMPNATKPIHPHTMPQQHHSGHAPAAVDPFYDPCFLPTDFITNVVPPPPLDGAGPAPAYPKNAMAGPATQAAISTAASLDMDLTSTQSNQNRVSEILVSAIPAQQILHYFRRLPRGSCATIVWDFGVPAATTTPNFHGAAPPPGMVHADPAAMTRIPSPEHALMAQDRLIPRYFNIENLLTRIRLISPTIQAHYSVQYTPAFDDGAPPLPLNAAPQFHCSMFFLSSCGRDSNAFETEINGEERGVFTWAIQRVLSETRLTPSMRYIQHETRKLTGNLQTPSGRIIGEFPEIYALPGSMLNAIVPF